MDSAPASAPTALQGTPSSSCTATTTVDPRPLVVVAGATGHIGGEVVKELLRSGKFRVRAVVRPRKQSPSTSDAPSSAAATTSFSSAASSRLARLGAQVWHGDVTDPATIEGCCDGASAAVSALGVRSFDRSDGSIWSVDRDGTLAFFEQARAAAARPAAAAASQSGNSNGGLGVFVMVATFEGKASRSNEAISEAKEQAVDGISTAASDDAKRSNSKPIKVRVLRPTAYFRDMSSWLLEPLLSGKKGDVALTGDGGTRINPVDGRDVARLIRAEIERSLSATASAATGGAGGDDLVREIPVGGPQVFTLRSMAALAAEVAASKLRGGVGTTTSASSAPSAAPATTLSSPSLPHHHEPPAPIVIRSRPLWPLKLLAPLAGLLAPCWGKAAALRDGARFVLYSATHDAVAETGKYSSYCTSTLRKFFEERADAVLSAAEKAGSMRRRRRPRVGTTTSSTSASAEGGGVSSEVEASAAAPTTTSKVTTEGTAAPLPVSAAASGP